MRNSRLAPARVHARVFYPPIGVGATPATDATPLHRPEWVETPTTSAAALSSAHQREGACDGRWCYGCEPGCGWTVLRPHVGRLATGQVGQREDREDRELNALVRARACARFARVRSLTFVRHFCCVSSNTEALSATGAAAWVWGCGGRRRARRVTQRSSVSGGSAPICRSRAGRKLSPPGDRPSTARHAQPRPCRGIDRRSPATRQG
jgi:hypothetical protein